MGNIQLFGFALIMTASSGSLAAEDFKPPRLDFGVPDLQGIWNYQNRTSLERPAIYEGELEIDQATMLDKMVSTPDYIAALEATGAEAPGPHNVGGYNGCLLYTSPSPRDGLLSRMPSSA